MKKHSIRAISFQLPCPRTQGDLWSVSHGTKETSRGMWLCNDHSWSGTSRSTCIWHQRCQGQREIASRVRPNTEENRQDLPCCGSMMTQMKVVDDGSSATMSAIKSENDQGQRPMKDVNNVRECWNCGCWNELHKRELCPAYSKTCNKCWKPNHFAAKCHSKQTPKTVRAVKEDEVYQTQMPGADADDSQFGLSAPRVSSMKMGNYAYASIRKI